MYRVWYRKLNDNPDPNERNWMVQEDRFGKADVNHKNFFMMNVLDVHGESEKENLELVFIAMQGENWSPKGEMRDFVRASGTAHTSMMTGDVVENVETGDMYQVAFMGFDKLA